MDEKDIIQAYNNGLNAVITLVQDIHKSLSEQIIIQVNQLSSITPGINGFIVSDITYGEAQEGQYQRNFRVEVVGTDKVAYTDRSGFFSLINVPGPSNHEGLKVLISKPGYLSREITIFPIKGEYIRSTQKSLQ